MKLTEIKKIAVQYGLSTAKLNKSELIMAIQVAEGNTPCFDTGTAAECEQAHCLWRGDCR